MQIGRLTSWEEVGGVLGVELSPVDLSYKLVGVTRRFKEPGGVCCGFVSSCGVDRHAVSRVVARSDFWCLGHVRLKSGGLRLAV